MKIIHPFDLIKIASDWRPGLFKSQSYEDRPPRYEGEIHHTGKYVGVAYHKISPKGMKSPHARDANGRATLVWQTNESDAKRDDAALNNIKNIQGIVGRNPADNLLFSGFVNKVSKDPGRHARKSFPGESNPRARHVVGLIESPHAGHDAHFFTSKGKRYMAFQAIRHGRSDVPKGHLKAERWVFDGEKIFKTPEVPDQTFHEKDNVPKLKDFFGEYV